MVPSAGWKNIGKLQALAAWIFRAKSTTLTLHQIFVGLQKPLPELVPTKTPRLQYPKEVQAIAEGQQKRAWWTGEQPSPPPKIEDPTIIFQGGMLAFQPESDGSQKQISPSNMSIFGFHVSFRRCRKQGSQSSVFSNQDIMHTEFHGRFFGSVVGLKNPLLWNCDPDSLCLFFMWFFVLSTIVNHH